MTVYCFIITLIKKSRGHEIKDKHENWKRLHPHTHTHKRVAVTAMYSIQSLTFPTFLLMICQNRFVLTVLTVTTLHNRINFSVNIYPYRLTNLASQHVVDSQTSRPTRVLEYGINLKSILQHFRCGNRRLWLKELTMRIGAAAGS